MPADKAAFRPRALKLFSRVLPALVRALTPRRIFFDRSRRARRLTDLAAPPPKGFPPAHRHASFEMCILLSGRCPFLLGQERRQLRRGDVVILSPEAFHRELAADNSPPYELLWLCCGRPNASAHIQVHLGKGRFDASARRVDLAVPGALQLCQAIDTELWEDRPGAFHRVQGMLLELCGLFHRALAEDAGGDQPVRDAEALQRWRTEKALEYIRDHFAQPLDLGEVALHVGVSAAYLSALFSRELGRSFTDFLAACRIEEAQRLMANPSLSIKEVSARVGLGNPLYFSRLFRKHTGIPPRQFRRRLAAPARG